MFNYSYLNDQHGNMFAQQAESRKEARRIDNLVLLTNNNSLI